MDDLPGNPHYSTVRTQLRVLEEKGHVTHEEAGRPLRLHAGDAAPRRPQVGAASSRRHVLRRVGRAGRRGRARRRGRAGFPKKSSIASRSSSKKRRKKEADEDVLDCLRRAGGLVPPAAAFGGAAALGAGRRSRVRGRQSASRPPSCRRGRCRLRRPPRSVDMRIHSRNRRRLHRSRRARQRPLLLRRRLSRGRRRRADWIRGLTCWPIWLAGAARRPLDSADWPAAARVARRSCASNHARTLARSRERRFRAAMDCSVRSRCSRALIRRCSSRGGSRGRR